MKKKVERKKLAYYISQLLTRQCKFIDRLKYSLRYRRCSKDGIEVKKIKTLNKYEIKKGINMGVRAMVCMFGMNEVLMFSKDCSRGYFTDENSE